MRRRIAVPAGERIRPTADRVREAVFSSLQSRTDLGGATALDLFAGSGALGFESISRGCSRATFVDSDHVAVDTIGKNAADLDVADRCEVVLSRCEDFLAAYKGPPFDIVFADPPYGYDAIPELLNLCREVLGPDGWIVLEHASNRPYDDLEGFVSRRKYGRTSVSYFSAVR